MSCHNYNNQSNPKYIWDRTNYTMDGSLVTGLRPLMTSILIWQLPANKLQPQLSRWYGPISLTHGKFGTPTYTTLLHNLTSQIINRQWKHSTNKRQNISNGSSSSLQTTNRDNTGPTNPTNTAVGDPCWVSYFTQQLKAECKQATLHTPDIWTFFWLPVQHPYDLQPPWEHPVTLHQCGSSLYIIDKER